MSRSARIRHFGAVASEGTIAAIEAGQWVSFHWQCAPEGYATRRQLAALGLRPGGQQPRAEVRWGRGHQRFAYLYLVASAKPKRPPTPAQRAALAKAMAARRTCTTCGRDAGYCLPLTRECLDCTYPSSPAAADGPRDWWALPQTVDPAGARVSA